MPLTHNKRHLVSGLLVGRVIWSFGRADKVDR